ncbi:MAG: alpha-amylase family glycosyl hydrolase [Clostridium sp.]|nr:alpha-amylase family glycosyl hydrolase [Clostridium sp.]MCM1474949.1 alpha-amylase family glycosyl hydrolase [Muribaculaceae bacterium]
MKIKLLTLILMLSAFLGVHAQLSTDPLIVQEDTQNLTVYFRANQGNKALANLPASTPIYAHTGVLTTSSKSDSDWKYAPEWTANSPKYLCEYVSENLYKIYIGDIRTFYGITNPAETVKKLAFLFRTADGSKVGRAADGSDMFITLSDSGLQVAIETDLDGTLVTPSTAKVHFRIGSTEPARLSLGINGVEVGYKENATLFEIDYTFTERGSYNCYGNASIGDVTKSQKITLSYAEESKPVPYPGGGTPKMGVHRNADGTVTFCLAAPEKSSVLLVGSWKDYEVTDELLMNYTDVDDIRYFWINVPGLDETSQYIYYYLIDGITKVGDPYAKLVLDPNNDKYISANVYPNLPAYPTEKVRDVPLAIYQENINTYDWQIKDFKPAPKQDLIIYELLLRDFTGTEGRKLGNGTVKKAIEKIPYLVELGVNVVELLPINEFNGNNSWGYNPNFYFAPDKAYGTPDDYKEFIDLCHKNGIAVVLDMVFNQSDWLHPWYKMYPVGSNPMYNATAPHAYSVLNDWNQGHPLVRRQWKDVVAYWMTEYKVDGFRFDLVKGLGNNDSYANNGDAATNAYNASRVANMRDIQTAMLAVNPNCIFINENLAAAKEENEMAAFGQLNWANVNNEGCQFAMGLRSSSNLNRMYAPRDGRDWGSTVSYLESHDEQRLAYRQNTDGATGVKGNKEVSMRRLGCAAAQMILAPGAHMIWQFSEMGNAENTKSSNGNNTSPKTVNWNLLDDPLNHGLFETYRQLIEIRRNNTELFAQDANYQSNCGSTNWATGRSMVSIKGNKELITIINPNVDQAIEYSYAFSNPSQDAYQIIAKSYESEPTFDVATGKVNVPANCFVTIATKNVSEVKGIETNAETLAIYGGQGEIILPASVDCQVYSISGALIYSGNADRVAVPAGVYVVRCGQYSVKTIVR